MLELLQANHRIGGAELARRLRVDERTVRRYAARLEELGVPVVAERGRHGGYRLRPGYKLPPLMLTDDEATAVVLGLLAGRRLGLPGQATESALAKVRRVLPTALAQRVQALEETLGFTLAARDGTAPATAALLTLAEAARARRRVRIGYRSWREATSERDLDPYGLVFHSGRWYVTGHDHASGEVRTFRVDRVRTATLGSDTYQVPDDVDPVQHVTRSLAAVPYTHEVEVWLPRPARLGRHPPRERRGSADDRARREPPRHGAAARRARTPLHRPPPRRAAEGRARPGRLPARQRRTMKTGRQRAGKG
jgi:predicted DNA-binding transcriptional regulator YafY